MLLGDSLYSFEQAEKSISHEIIMDTGKAVTIQSSAVFSVRHLESYNFLKGVSLSAVIKTRIGFSHDGKLDHAALGDESTLMSFDLKYEKEIIPEVGLRDVQNDNPGKTVVEV